MSFLDYQIKLQERPFWVR